MIVLDPRFIAVVVLFLYMRNFHSIVSRLVGLFYTQPTSPKSDFKYHSIGTALSGNRFGSSILDYAYSSDIMVDRVRPHVHSKHHSRSTILTAHIQSMSHIANVMFRLAVIFLLTSFFARYGFLQVLLVQGLCSHSRFSNTSTILLCKARQQLMTFITLWYTKRTILVSNRPP